MTAPPPPRSARQVALGRAVLAALRRVSGGGLDFVRRVYNKAGQDDIFFLAGAIAFNVMMTAVPFLLLVVAGLGFVLRWAVDDPGQVAVSYVVSVLPPSQKVAETTRTIVNDLIAGRTRFGLVALFLFIWTSTRLFGTLRSTLKEIFELQDERGIVAGKLFDIQMVVVAGLLFLANTGITIVVEAVRSFGLRWLDRYGWEELPFAQQAYARILAFGFIFLMFVLIYRFLPLRRTRWSVAFMAGGFTAVMWELLKGVFAWYVTYVANYASTYGRLATLVILVFWIYYSAVIFILGGEVAQVWNLLRIRRKQRELLE